MLPQWETTIAKELSFIKTTYSLDKIAYMSSSQSINLATNTNFYFSNFGTLSTNSLTISLGSLYIFYNYYEGEIRKLEPIEFQQIPIEENEPQLIIK